MNLAAPSYLFALVVCLLGILGEWGPPALAGLWRLPAGAWVLLLTFEGLVARHRRLDLRRELPERLRLGAEEGAALVVENYSPRPLTVVALDETPDGIEPLTGLVQLAAPAHGSGRVTSRLRASRLGEVVWREPVGLRLRGHLGLAWWSRRLAAPGATVVVPARLGTAERHRAAQSPVGESARRRSGEGAELLWLREYRPGDPVQRIDWKATARSGRTTVRVMAEEQHLELTLMIDAGHAGAIQAGPLTRLGHYSNIAARLAEKALAHGDRLHLVVFADRVLATATGLRGAAGITRARGLIERLAPAPAASNPLPAALEVRRLVRRRSLVVLLTDPDDGEGGSDLLRAVALLRPTHQPLVAGITDPGVLELLDRPAGEWLDPYRSLAAQETAEGWRRIGLRLKRLGAEVVLAPEARLDALVLAGYEALRQRGRV